MKGRYAVYAAYAGLLFGLALLQVAFGQLIAIDSVRPDFVLIGVVIIALRSGQITATSAGFLAGLVLDLSIGEVVGLGALAKTCAGFAAGYFHEDDKKDLNIRTPKLIWITAIASLIHNAIYLLAVFQRPDLDVGVLFLRFGIGGTLYTTVFGAICMLILMRTGKRIRV